MLMSRLCTDRQTDGNVKVEQYSAEAESAILPKGQYFLIHSLGQLSGTRAENIDTEGTMKTFAGK